MTVNSKSTIAKKVDRSVRPTATSALPVANVPLAQEQPVSQLKSTRQILVERTERKIQRIDFPQRLVRHRIVTAVLSQFQIEKRFLLLTELLPTQLLSTIVVPPNLLPGC